MKKVEVVAAIIYFKDKILCVQSQDIRELPLESFKCYSETMNIQLNEHISSQWLPLEKLIEIDWAAADIPIVNRLVKNE